MSLIAALLVILVAWLIFKSILAVLIALVIVAVALYIVRGSGRL